MEMAGGDSECYPGEGGDDYEEVTESTDLQRCAMCQSEVIVYSKESIVEHLVVAHGKDPPFRRGETGHFMCLFCDYQTRYKQNVLHHTKCQHLKLKDKINYRCNRCSYVCTYKSQIANHVKSVHKKIRDWRCPECDYACSAKPALKLHIRAKHVKGNYDFTCEICGFGCNLKHVFRKHVEASHPGQEMRICNQIKCKFACATVAVFVKHLKGVHNKKYWSGVGNVSINKTKYRPIKRSSNKSSTEVTSPQRGPLDAELILLD